MRKSELLKRIVSVESRLVLIENEFRSIKISFKHISGLSNRLEQIEPKLGSIVHVPELLVRLAMAENNIKALCHGVFGTEPCKNDEQPRKKKNGRKKC